MGSNFGTVFSVDHIDGPAGWRRPVGPTVPVLIWVGNDEADVGSWLDLGAPFNAVSRRGRRPEATAIQPRVLPREDRSRDLSAPESLGMSVSASASPPSTLLRAIPSSSAIFFRAYWMRNGRLIVDMADVSPSRCALAMSIDRMRVCSCRMRRDWIIAETSFSVCDALPSTLSPAEL